LEPLFHSPDHQNNFIQKVFKRNSQTVQAISFTLFGIFIYDLGYNESLHQGFIGIGVTCLLLAMALGYTIKLFSKLEEYTISRYVSEISIVILLLFAALTNLKIIPFASEWTLANIGVKAFFVNMVIFLLFLVELSKVSLAVNRLKIHPAMIFILSFFIVILLGMGLLLLPNATLNGISIIDALFYFHLCRVRHRPYCIGHFIRFYFYGTGYHHGIISGRRHRNDDVYQLFWFFF